MLNFGSKGRQLSGLSTCFDSLHTPTPSQLEIFQVHLWHGLCFAKGPGTAHQCGVGG